MAKTFGPTTVGENVVVSHDDKTLTIVIDLTKENGVSASGKTRSIASTKGNKAVANVNGKQVFLGLNLYRYEQEK
jgi:hypothetical protein